MTIRVYAEFTCQGKAAQKSAVVEPLVGVGRRNKGCLSYDVYAEGSRLFIAETYKDDAAVLAALQDPAFKPAVDAFFAVFKPAKIQVLGEPGKELRDMWTGLGGLFAAPLLHK